MVTTCTNRSSLAKDIVDLSKGLQAAGGCGKVNTSNQQSNPENFEHTLENFIKKKVYNDLKDETEKNTRKLKEFIIEDLKPAIKSEIEGKLITDVNHAVSDVNVTVLAELLKCKSEIYELKESQLRLDQQSFNSSKSAGNLSETGPNSGVHGGNITTSVDSNSSSTKPQDCRKVTLEANKDADKDKMGEKFLYVGDSLFHRLKPNEVFIKNKKPLYLQSQVTLLPVLSKERVTIRNAQATSFTGIVLMAGTNDLGGRKKSNGNDKKPEDVAQELVNGAKKLLSFKSVKNVFICEVSPRLKRMKKYSSLITV